MYKLCILEAGYINPILKEKYPSYSRLFSDFLKTKSRKWNVSSYQIYNNEFPSNINDYNGFIITGSSYGVYENYDWIIKSIKLINEIIIRKKQLVGICFGHQIIVQALNGLVEKHSKGWGTGIQPVKFYYQKPWLPKFNECINLVSFHQDQVIKIPGFMTHLAESEFCKYYSLSLDDLVFTIQGHPEFSNAYALDLLEIKKDNIEKKLYLESKRVLQEETHQGNLFGNYIANFLDKNFLYF